TSSNVPRRGDIRRLAGAVRPVVSLYAPRDQLVEAAHRPQRGDARVQFFVAERARLGRAVGHCGGAPILTPWRCFRWSIATASSTSSVSPCSAVHSVSPQILQTTPWSSS